MMTAHSSPYYDVPSAARGVFIDGILQNPKCNVSAKVMGLARRVKFVGSAKPAIAIPWRFAESAAALKALEGTYLNVLVQQKYECVEQDLVINTDHANLLFLSAVIWTVDPEGNALTIRDMIVPGPRRELMRTYFKDMDLFNATSSAYRSAATNIYRTDDSRFFHVHGSLNPSPSLQALGLPLDMEGPENNRAAAISTLSEAVSRKTADELDKIMNDEVRQSGTIAYTAQEYRDTKHGKANDHVGLWETLRIDDGSTPGWWLPGSATPSAQRPLAGLRVLDLTRIIAGPAITKGLAEYGASVMRITAAHQPDLTVVHPDTNWGKWCAELDLREFSDRKKIEALISDADVVVDGYRPGVMERLGFGREAVLKIAAERKRGIIHLRENCYGWHGPWANRSGWQQISDACTGVSYEFGRALGVDEPITPVFPNADYATGSCGTTAVIDALIRQAEEGGSFTVDVALNYYNRWLVESCGMYPAEVWESLYQLNGQPKFRHTDSMAALSPPYIDMIVNNAPVVLSDNFLEVRRSGVLGVVLKVPKPIVSFSITQPRFDIGTRGNGVDMPRWPKNLRVETVTAEN